MKIFNGLVLVIITMVSVFGCKIRTINDGKPPRDGVLKVSRENRFYGKLEVEEHYKNGQLEIMKAWYDNGKTAFENYYKNDNRLYDSLISYYRNGQTRSMTLQQDTGRIQYREYYENGTVKVSADSELNRAFYESGEKESDIKFKQGQVVKVMKWYPNGRLSDESEWWSDKRNGKWFEWDSTGKQIRNEKYKNNVKIK